MSGKGNDRQTYKEELTRAEGNLDWAMTHIMRMAQAYQEHHPEVSEVCELAGAGLMGVQELLATLKKMI